MHHDETNPVSLMRVFLGCSNVKHSAQEREGVN